MKAYAIDFAPPSAWRAMLRVSPMLWIAVCSAAGVFLYALLGIFNVDAQLNEAGEKVQQAKAALQKRSAPAPVVQKFVVSDTQAQAINQAVAQLNLPWYALLNAVEAATPKHIALIALEPDAKKQVIKGTAEAGGINEMLVYIERLKQQTLFSDVVLAKQEINLRDPNNPIRFQFHAHWEEVVQ